MSEATPAAVPDLALDAVAQASAELAAQPDLGGTVARFLDLVRSWAAPSAVVAVVRDPDAESGWRLLPALCAGSVPVGTDRAVARLVTETPDCLVRPAVVRGEEVAGVRVRDNVTVPWRWEGASGLLLLRGVPRPFPANLGAALSLVAAPVWPWLLGSPAARLEVLLGELRSASARLETEVARYAERLEAQGRTVTLEPAPADEQAASVEREKAAAIEDRRRLEESLGEARARVDELERVLSAERESRAAESGDLTARVEALKAERDAAAEARRRADQSLATAREQLEEGRRVAEAAEARAGRVEEELRTAQRELALARARVTRPEEGASDLQARLEEARTAARSAEARTGDLHARWEKAAATLGGALTALRRAAFVPPALRVSLEVAGTLFEAGGPPARRIGIAVLDRDAVGLEGLAVDLEATGIGVRIANQPEELAILLRTAGAEAIDAVVCDVMSFRAEQNVAGLIRSWDRDRPGLVFYLSYDPQSSAEAERARRIPMSLTAGHLPRPLVAARVAEAVENLVRRQGKA